jgi:hypothetical protein
LKRKPERPEIAWREARPRCWKPVRNQSAARCFALSCWTNVNLQEVGLSGANQNNTDMTDACLAGQSEIGQSVRMGCGVAYGVKVVAPDHGGRGEEA